MVAFPLFAIVGAYADWQLWPAYEGIVITVGAGGLILLGALLAVIARGRLRLGSLVVVAWVGLVAGQSFGPRREPLIFGDGLMTIHLTSPTVATAMGAANCRNVSSEREFAVDGDSNMRLDTPDGPFILAAIDVGDPWRALRESPRTNGVALQIILDGAAVPVSGKAASTIMVAGPTSTLESSFSSAGGPVTFRNLIPSNRPDSNGASIALAGTITWTCIAHA